MSLKTGDKKQAAILSVVAVGAIGFLASQFLHFGKGESVQTGRVAQAAQDAAFTTTGLPTALLRDSFSNPALAPKKASKEMEKGVGEPPPFGEAKYGIPPQLRGQIQGRGPLPNAEEGDTSPVEVVGPSGGAAQPNPKKSTGNNQLVKGVPTTVKVRLDGTMKMDKYVALISIDGSDTMRCSAGSTIAPGIWIVEISDREIHLIVRGQKGTLAVGQVKSL